MTIRSATHSIWRWGSAISVRSRKPTDSQHTEITKLYFCGLILMQAFHEAGLEVSALWPYETLTK